MKLRRTKHTYLHAWTIPTCNIQTHTIEYQPPASTNHHAPAPCLKSFELRHKRRDHLWQLALELFKGSLRQTGSSMTPFNLTGNQADQQLRRQYNAWKKTGKRTQHTQTKNIHTRTHNGFLAPCCIQMRFATPEKSRRAPSCKAFWLTGLLATFFFAVSRFSSTFHATSVLERMRGLTLVLLME